MERWEREQSLSVGAAQPWHRLSSLELIYHRELLHLDGLQIPCQNPILISPIIILSDSVILFPRLYRELQSFHDRESKQRTSTFDLTPELTCSHPTPWDRYKPQKTNHYLLDRRPGKLPVSRRCVRISDLGNSYPTAIPSSTSGKNFGVLWEVSAGSSITLWPSCGGQQQLVPWASFNSSKCLGEVREWVICSCASALWQN